jgi:hypothetical protein
LPPKATSSIFNSAERIGDNSPAFQGWDGNVAMVESRQAAEPYVQ